MNEEVFQLLQIINDDVNHEFVGVGGSNNDQRIADEHELSKYEILVNHSLINRTERKKYTITEYGTLVAQHSSWEDYLIHVRDINARKVKKEKLDLKISEFQVRSRNWPIIISIIGLIISAIALFNSGLTENPTEIKQDVETVKSPENNPPKIPTNFKEKTSQ